MLRARHGDIEAAAPPDRNEEYLFYQLMIATWPVEFSGNGCDLNCEDAAEATLNASKAR